MVLSLAPKPATGVEFPLAMVNWTARKRTNHGPSCATAGPASQAAMAAATHMSFLFIFALAFFQSGVFPCLNWTRAGP